MAGIDETGALRALCYALAGVYGIQSVYALVKLVILWRASAGRHSGCCGCGWSSQKMLHALVLAVGLGACTAHHAGVGLLEASAHFDLFPLADR